MSSGNWVIDNLNNALQTWNEKLEEIWQLVSQSPTEFKGGGIWNVIVNIHGALQAIGLALLVLFFVIGVVKTCGSFAEVKAHYRPPCAGLRTIKVMKTTSLIGYTYHYTA